MAAHPHPQFDKGSAAVTMCRSISSIRIGERHRRHLGDIDGLARSIREVGLLHPIVIINDGWLIAGLRRLEACKALGWTKVPVHVVDLKDIMRGELAENVIRQDFLPSEIDAIRRAMLPAEREAATIRKVSGRSVADAGETRDKIGAFAGVSGRTIAKIAAVVEAAEREPEKFGSLIAEMNRTRKVDGAYRKLQQMRDAERVRLLTPIQGRFGALLVDPPWAYEGHGRGAPPYDTMRDAQMLALPVPALAADESHLYLCVTNTFMRSGFELMDAWGFEFKTILTWCKDRYGLGSYFRGSTEHVLFGVRGGLQTRSNSIGTHFTAPLGKHSEKPERLYEIIREASYGPFGELFQRQSRPDFVNCFTTKVAAPSIPPGCSVRYGSGGPILFWPRTPGQRIARRSLWQPSSDPANDVPAKVALTL